MGIEISVTEFKAKCLDLIDKVSRHEIDSIELTKRGKPIAVVSAKEPAKSRTYDEAYAEMRAWQSSMKDFIRIDPDHDFTQPVFDIEDFDAFHGKLVSDDD